MSEDFQDPLNALAYLAKTDEPYAKAKARAKACEILLKQTVAAELITAEGKTVAERQAIADTSDAAKQAAEDIENASATSLIMENKRYTASQYFEYFRTDSNNKRHGIVT